MLEYRREAAFAGNETRAVATAARLLAELGYRIEELDGTHVKAEHPGLLNRASGQALLVASPLALTVSSGRLVLEADFDGIDRLRRFLVRLLVGLGAGLALVLGLAFSLVFDEVWPALLGGGLGLAVPLIQLPIHLVLTLPLVRRRAARDLDTFLGNVIVLSGGPQPSD